MIFCQFICLCTIYGAEARKRVSDPLELEFQVILSHYVGAGDQAGIS